MDHAPEGTRERGIASRNGKCYKRLIKSQVFQHCRPSGVAINAEISVPVAACENCRGHRFKPYFDGVLNRKTLTIVECEDCGLRFQNPMRTKSVTDVHYREMALAGDCSSGKSPRNGSYESELLALGKLTPGRRMLDVGCGTGHFLSIAKANGWITKGVELNQSCATFAREKLGLDVINGDIGTPELHGQKFDAIVLSFVLEHIPNVREVLTAALGMLAQGGVAYIVLPNCNAMSVRVRHTLGRFEGSREADSGHMYFFTPRSASALVSAAGGHVVRLRSGISGGFLLNRVSLHVGPMIAAVASTLDLVSGYLSLGSTLRIWVRNDQGA